MSPEGKTLPPYTAEIFSRTARRFERGFGLQIPCSFGICARRPVWWSSRREPPDRLKFWFFGLASLAFCVTLGKRQPPRPDRLKIGFFGLASLDFSVTLGESAVSPGGGWPEPGRAPGAGRAHQPGPELQEFRSIRGTAGSTTGTADWRRVCRCRRMCCHIFAACMGLFPCPYLGEFCDLPC